MIYLELLEMECRVEDSPVLHPFLTLVARESVGDQLRQGRELGLLEVAELVGEQVLDQHGIGDGHVGNRPEPGEARLAVLLDVVVEERRDPGGRCRGPGPCLLVEPAELLEVAGEEPV